MEEEARAAAELMEGRIAHETLGGDTEVELLRQSLERTQIMSMEVLEILDAYERRYRGR